ncbi:MAG: PIN domain-containing protein [Halohasta sp.]
MTFLDSSIIIDLLEGVDETVEFVQSQGEPFLTSSICVYEVLEGPLGRGSTDIVAERQRFGGIRALEFNDDLAMEAARLQDELLEEGRRMAVRDLMIAATARSTGDHLVVADADFQTRVLESKLPVTNLRSA